MCFVLFPGTTSALMRTFTRQQYLLHAPRKKSETNRNKWKINAKIKRTNTCENKAKKVKKKRQTRTATLFLRFLFALPFAFFWLLVSMGWRARQNSIIHI